MDNGHPPVKERKGFRQSVKDFLSPSRIKLHRRSGSPLPPNASPAQHGPDALPGLSRSTSAPTQPTPSLPLPSADDPTSESPSNPSLAGLKVAGRFIQTLVTKLPEVVDGNPAKMALSLAKVIIEVKKGVEDNMDTVERRIASTGEQLVIVARALEGWQARNEKEKQCVERLEKALQREFEKLVHLRQECLGRKIIDYEDEKLRIADIFERVNDARIQFGLETDLRVFKIINAIEESHRRSLLKDLRPSDLADHKYHLEGEKKEVLRRAVCTPGTRERLLNDIVTWAKNPSSETIYWLFGPAGTGKSTIAYTTARRFELATPEDTIALGGNFFSSRQFEETRFSTRIIRTITYHLALRCRAFADALAKVGQFDTVNQSVSAQLDGLLVGPWKAAESVRLADPSKPPQQYLIVIDALDEIGGTGGSEFLSDLLNVINAKHLTGLKFFVTSRPDPKLVAWVVSFGDKQLYRLEEVPFVEVEADISTYLHASLPSLAKGTEVGKLTKLAAGLFIYAATVVKYLEGHTKVEQKSLLKRLLPVSDLLSATPQTSPDATVLLDHLYHSMLLESFDKVKDNILTNRLKILHTILCTAERTSPTIVATLLFPCDADQPEPDIEAAHEVVKNLYAVLYTDNDKVLWYHKSFPDFLFDRNRSKEFWCNEAEHHRRLLDASFRVMKEGLHFNIATIESSFILDRDNDTLPGAVAENISPTLSYSCRNWEWHLLSTATPVDSDPLNEMLSEFLRCHALFWIEAMNLLERSGLCDQMLRRASQWVASTNPTLRAQFVEAADFSTYFAGSLAASSSPHLYISALSTWPRNSEPCRSWKNNFPGIPAFRNAAQGDSLSLVTIRVESAVNSVAFSTDGTLIVSGSNDNFVRVWDASTGKELHTLVGHTDSVNSVAFSTDGTRIVSGSDDRSVQVWDALMDKQPNKLMGHTDAVESVAFSGDGTRIVSGSADQSVRVWDALTCKEINILRGHTGPVYSVALSTDGTRIVSGSYDESVRIWNASTGDELNVLNGHTHWVLSVAFSTDGTQIVSGSRDKSVRVWDASTGKELNVLMARAYSFLVTSVAFSTNGTHIVSGAMDNSVRVWDLSTGKKPNVLKGHTDDVNSVAFSSDGARIVSGSKDNTVRVWGVPMGKELTALPVVDHTDSVNSIPLSSSSSDNSVQAVDRPTAKELNAPIGHTGTVYSVAFSTDGTRIVSGSSEKSVRVWDASTGKELNALIGHTNEVNSVAFSGDGTCIVSGSDDNSVRVWDALTGKELNVLTGHTKPVWSVAFSTDGTRIVSGSFDESVRVWDALTGMELNVLTGHAARVYSVAFSNDGTRIVSGSEDKSVQVWDASMGKNLNKLLGHDEAANSVVFSHDGTRIVSASLDKSVRVWNTSTGKELNVLTGHTGFVMSVAFSNDGMQIVSGSSDKSVRVWDAMTGKELTVLTGHTGLVYSVAFSPDGTRIVSGSSDKTVRVWDLQLQNGYFREQADQPSSESDPVYTGWLLSTDRQARLMFVPPDALALLPDYQCTLTIPHTAASSVDFTNAKIGPQWAECYHP